MTQMNQNLENYDLQGSNFTYSAVRIDKLGSTKYTLVTIVIDISGSVCSFKNGLEKCLKEIIKSCKFSPQADSLMIRIITFNNSVTELHGFKLFEEINPNDYTNILNPEGRTALYDATYTSIEASVDWAEKLSSQEFDVNGIIFVLTDGMDNQSAMSAKNVKEILNKAVKEEALESIVSVLIGVGVDSSDVDQYLKNFYQEAGFTQYQIVANANEKTLAKIAGFVSKSISLQSQSIGSNGPSQQISLTI